MATMSSMLSPPPSGRCSNGILTFFCPTEANLKSLDTFCAEKTNYAVYGKAVCQRTKLPLIRLVFKLKKRCSITTVQNILGDDKQCGFRPFSEMGVLGDPESSKFAPKYAKKGDQTEIEWEMHGDSGPNFGLNYKGKEFHEWFSKGVPSLSLRYKYPFANMTYCEHERPCRSSKGIRQAAFHTLNLT